MPIDSDLAAGLGRALWKPGLALQGAGLGAGDLLRGLCQELCLGQPSGLHVGGWEGVSILAGASIME